MAHTRLIRHSLVSFNHRNLGMDAGGHTNSTGGDGNWALCVRIPIRFPGIGPGPERLSVHTDLAVATPGLPQNRPILVCQDTSELFGTVGGKSTARLVPKARPIAS